MSETKPNEFERRAARDYPLDLAVDVARLAIRRDLARNSVSLYGAAVEAHAVEALIAHALASGHGGAPHE